jgi:hypothetical protein
MTQVHGVELPPSDFYYRTSTKIATKPRPSCSFEPNKLETIARIKEFHATIVQSVHPYHQQALFDRTEPQLLQHTIPSKEDQLVRDCPEKWPVELKRFETLQHATTRPEPQEDQPSSASPLIIHGRQWRKDHTNKDVWHFGL